MHTESDAGRFFWNEIKCCSQTRPRLCETNRIVSVVRQHGRYDQLNETAVFTPRCLGNCMRASGPRGGAGARAEDAGWGEGARHGGWMRLQGCG